MSECELCKRDCAPPNVEVNGRMVKNPNGFSRQHWTSKPFEAYQAAKDARLNEASARMKRNILARAKRSPQQQLKLIAKRRGESKREAARLRAKIEEKHVAT